MPATEHSGIIAGLIHDGFDSRLEPIADDNYTENCGLSEREQEAKVNKKH